MNGGGAYFFVCYKKFKPWIDYFSAIK